MVLSHWRLLLWVWPDMDNVSASYSDGASAGAYVGLRTLGGDVQNGSLLVDGIDRW